ncbi:hypothetical protein F5Y17DRAFT_50044 [Xylariaceae sp. FL0594]|nr:hypothetical protein F5Y17DRAFT_50044 [Xylariaceae sp. FL0594]
MELVTCCPWKYRSTSQMQWCLRTWSDLLSLALLFLHANCRLAHLHEFVAVHCFIHTCGHRPAMHLVVGEVLGRVLWPAEKKISHTPCQPTYAVGIWPLVGRRTVFVLKL